MPRKSGTIVRKTLPKLGEVWALTFTITEPREGVITPEGKLDMAIYGATFIQIATVVSIVIATEPQKMLFEFTGAESASLEYDFTTDTFAVPEEDSIFIECVRAATDVTEFLIKANTQKKERKP